MYGYVCMYVWDVYAFVCISVARKDRTHQVPNKWFFLFHWEKGESLLENLRIIASLSLFLSLPVFSFSFFFAYSPLFFSSFSIFFFFLSGRAFETSFVRGCMHISIENVVGIY